MKRCSNIVLANFVAALLGIALTFAFAPYYFFPLALLPPAGLLMLWLIHRDKTQAFFLGYSFGLGFFGSGVYWVYISIHRFGGVPSAVAFVITGAFIALLALFPAFQGYVLNRYFYRNQIKILCAFPAIWIFSEWARSSLFTGFPWLLIGYSQTNSPLKGYAPLFSVYGVSLAVVFSSALLVSAWVACQHHSLKVCLKRVGSLCLIWGVGFLLTLIPWTKPQGQAIPVSLVQGNIPQELKWSPEHLQLSLDRYKALTEPLLGKDKLIIWPEAAIPLSLQEATDYIDELDKKAKESGSQVILGIPIEANQRDYYNSIVTVGRENQVYLKRQLVPFGEYMPFPLLFSSLFNYLNIPMSVLIRGDINQKPLRLLNGLQLLPSICYEIAFPELMQTNNPNIGALLTITNDAWFGESNAQAQHLQMAEMRAIELQRPLLFVSNNGITAIINPEGNIDSNAPTNETIVLDGMLQARIGLTPWMRNGMDPVLFIVLCLLITAIKYRREIE